MDQPEPYFMKNNEWYYHDEKEFCYKLTEKAPPEAVKSYEEYYADDDYFDEKHPFRFMH